MDRVGSGDVLRSEGRSLQRPVQNSVALGSGWLSLCVGSLRTGQWRDGPPACSLAGAILKGGKAALVIVELQIETAGALVAENSAVMRALLSSTSDTLLGGLRRANVAASAGCARMPVVAGSQPQRL